MAIRYVNPYYSVYFAPRGARRMLAIGRQIAQQHLDAQDRLIGLMGEAGSGKSLLIKGMFPGLELTNDDNGVNVRPLPLLDVSDDGFYQPHTYHIDIRFEMGFTQLYILADAIDNAINKGRRVIVEHFELIYPMLCTNAELLIGIGEEIIVTRPTLFGPEPQEIAEIVLKNGIYRRMAHSAEDLTEFYLHQHLPPDLQYIHDDIRRGFLLRFPKKPQVVIEAIEHYVKDLISLDIPISYHDEQHIMIGDKLHLCTNPRMHVPSTGKIDNFHLLKEFHHDLLNDDYILVGLVGDHSKEEELSDINTISLD